MTIIDPVTSESSDERIARHQQVRLRRFYLSAVSYILQAALVIVITCRDNVSVAAGLCYIAVLLITPAIFYLIFRNGWNLYFSEPNLTLIQVLAPAVPGLWFLYQLETAESQAALVLTAVVPLLYGTLDLSMLGFIIAVAIYSLGYVAVIVFDGALHLKDQHILNNWVLLAAMMVVMPQIVLLSSLVNRLRRTLRVRNDEIRRAMARISALAVRDDLTGLYNRRWLMEILERERAMTQRREYRFCVAVIDVDFFKEINDNYGHPIGDRVLRQLGEHLSDETREADEFGRFGGEEFLWIMPDTDIQAATEAAERMRQRAASLRFTTDDGVVFSITLSIGLAENDHQKRLRNDALLRRTDIALYAAKDGGRNQVVQANTVDDTALDIASDRASRGRDTTYER